MLIGVGFEYAPAPNWTTKFEYNYIDYGNQVVDFTLVQCDNVVGCSTSPRSEALKEAKQIAKLGVSYKF